MQMREKEKREQRRAFCREYLETLDEQAAAERCGVASGTELLRSEAVRRELEKMRETHGDVRREDVLRKLWEMAAAPVGDVIRLVWMDEPTKEEIEGLNLKAVAELKRGANGGVEVKLIDRVKVLGTLGTMIGGGGRDDPEELIRALEAAGEENADWGE